GLSPAEAARLLADAGVRLVQVRDKCASSRERLSNARAAVRVLRASGALAVVNDRPDVALLSEADGVHLGEHDLPPGAARRVLPEAALVGASTHSVEEALAAMGDPSVSYVALGPIFATLSKETPHAPLGLAAVERAARAKTKPLVVIGGIGAADVGACLAAGADSVAMIAGLLDGDVRANVEAALASAGSRAPGRTA
ncbi:MAG TPA: thiamine phosphate synthase, partial [Thermoanaerobaculia bacterium]|nr:thiamine phosphate synthase [Thermoanaerobaculia bacterium]